MSAVCVVSVIPPPAEIVTVPPKSIVSVAPPPDDVNDVGVPELVDRDAVGDPFKEYVGEPKDNCPDVKSDEIVAYMFTVAAAGVVMSILPTLADGVILTETASVLLSPPSVILLVTVVACGSITKVDVSSLPVG